MIKNDRKYIIRSCFSIFRPKKVAKRSADQNATKKGGSLNKKFVHYQVIGQNNVAVPTHFFKTIAVHRKSDNKYDLKTFLFPNVDGIKGENLNEFFCDVEFVERVGGLMIYDKIPKELIKSVNKPIKQSA